MAKKKKEGGSCIWHQDHVIPWWVKVWSWQCNPSIYIDTLNSQDALWTKNLIRSSFLFHTMSCQKQRPVNQRPMSCENESKKIVKLLWHISNIVTTLWLEPEEAGTGCKCSKQIEGIQSSRPSSLEQSIHNSKQWRSHTMPANCLYKKLWHPSLPIAFRRTIAD